MHRTRMMMLFYCLTGIAAAFLTWVVQSLLGETTYISGIDPGYSVTHTNIGDGWLTVFCFAIIIIMVVTGNRNLSVQRAKRWWIALFALLSAFIGLYNLLIILTKSKANTGDSLVMKISPGIGVYLTIIVSVLLIIVPFQYKAAPGTKDVTGSK